MILINLLPHREARRQKRKQDFFAILGLFALIGAGIVLAWYTVVSTLISNQEQRNQFLSSEIKRLDAQIVDVSNLKAEIEALKARQKAVEDLQADRNMPVYLLNELVKQTPEAVYLTSVKQTGQQIAITGMAQTNERISEMLRNTANNSPWFERPILWSIKATGGGHNMFDFAMGLTLKRPPAPGAAPAVPAAASGPTPSAASASAASSSVKG